ncbi:MAG: HU family DNA-binding protein [Pseudomonadota bacterium]|jgi:DNA-binding protein HU-beta|nr:HU family DNA-binding protein [Pseudomonadota bacterium]QKK04173.1 MAG: HU family DNA-binding protein [Pseudomonadota bacterium]|tara:strand:+ start:1075 stop:1350 length:276 start_codon:yes stop_codon:yes gene_type:complete
MNKSELIDFIAKNAELKKTEAAKALEAFISGVSVTLKKGGKVQLIGFGTFDVTKRKATKGRNPQTGAEIQIPACNQVKFKVGKALKEIVNK